MVALEGLDAKEGRKAALRSIVRVPLINLHGKGMNWIINDDVRVSRDDSNYRASHTDNFQPRRSQKEVTFNNWQQLCLCFLLSALIG